MFKQRVSSLYQRKCQIYDIKHEKQYSMFILTMMDLYVLFIYQFENSIEKNKSKCEIIMKKIDQTPISQ